MFRQFITFCLLLCLTMGQAFAMQEHGCDEMKDDMNHSMSNGSHVGHHQMISEEETAQSDMPQKGTDCCNECICPGSTCSSLLFTVNAGVHSDFTVQQKQPQYQFSVIAAHLNLLQKPPISV